MGGDNNNNPIWDKPDRTWSHSRTDDLLEANLDCVSVYHQVRGEAHGSESSPTHYFRRDADSPFHIDFAYLPRAWFSSSVSVSVGKAADWLHLSDHFPLIVDVPVVTVMQQ